jgi:hypothetical protein
VCDLLGYISTVALWPDPATARILYFLLYIFGTLTQGFSNYPGVSRKDLGFQFLTSKEFSCLHLLCLGDIGIERQDPNGGGLALQYSSIFIYLM